MKESKRFDNILDECLEQILADRSTVEECLRQHPEVAEELEPLLRTATTARRSFSLEPRSEFRQRARYEFQKAIREMEPARPRGFFNWLPQWATVTAAALIVLVGGGGGVVYASGDSMPDEPLYPVKTAVEQVQVTFATSALAKADLYLRLADRRVVEIAEMAKDGKANGVEEATERLEQHLMAMATLSGADARGEEPLMMQAEPTSPLAAPREKEAPAPPTEETIGKAPEKTGEVIAPAPTPQPGIAAAPPEVTEPAPVDAEEGDERYLELRVELAGSAHENQQVLVALLESVPEEARPGLLRAIEVSSRGYEQALDVFLKGRKE